MSFRPETHPSPTSAQRITSTAGGPLPAGYDALYKSATLTQAAQSHPDCMVLAFAGAPLAAFISAETAQGVVGKYKIYTIGPGVLSPTYVAQYPKQTDGWKSVTIYQTPDVNPAWASYVKLQTAA